MTWGAMATPLLAIAAPESAICSGVDCTSCWPMADLASAGLSKRNADAGGNNDLATAGRSRGGAALKPKRSAPLDIFWAPRSRPIWANAVLQETAMICGNGPPHRSPPKFFSVCPPLWGSGSSVRDGYTGDVVVMLPSARPVDAVTILNVDPGK